MIDIAQAQTGIGEAYVFKKEFGKALNYLLDSLFRFPINHLGRANVFITMANLYDEIFEFKLALCFYKQVLNIYRQHLNENDLDFARLYSNMGVTYGRADNSELQLEYYGKAREIFLKASHPDHQQIATIDDNIVRAKEQQKLVQELYSIFHGNV
jgi:tetratricopeptide (TPR) repeat protein